ncbi:MAG: phospho-sugar mutase [Clostridiales bacterium]|nr:phospho-sugar mutase [Clostridiales bacterium]
MKYLEQTKKWISNPNLDEKVKEELLKALEPLKVYFYDSLDFGTAGLRGIMRPGTNSMNVHVIMQATQGLANLINEEKGQDRGVVISYDSRNNSRKFAEAAASVLAASNIRTYFFDELHPVPLLSFAVRELNCLAGIMITASHNPKEYNGYKVYWEDGAQLPPEHAKKVSGYIHSLDIFEDVKTIDFDKACQEGKIEIIGNDFDEKYFAEVIKQQANPDVVSKVADTFKLVYTPLHGSGYRLVPEVLRRIGFKAENILTVPEQMILDGDFPTVEKPNPEFKSSFNLGLEIAKKENCDLIIGTDPDADRMGIMLRKPDGEYITITGNQAGALMLDYIIKNRREKGTLPDNAYAVKSIVSTSLCDKICEKNNVKMYNVFTGFKFIGEKIKEVGEKDYIFGFEESYGYLAGTYARDKDAVYAAMIIAEMAAFYKTKNMSLYDALEGLYKEYGYIFNTNVTIRKEGVTAQEDMKKSMANLRANLPKQIAGIDVLKVTDYKDGIITNLKTGEKTNSELKDSNVIYFDMNEGSSLIARPSGTEPLIKVYFSIPAENEAKATQKFESYKEALTKML